MLNNTTNYQAKLFAHALTLEGGNGIARLQQSLMNASVDLNPHQVDAALFALHSPLSKGVLLADEVGLGKTIEAGLVMCQFWAERKRRILVVCPASLRKQWQCELEDKFGLPCCIVDAKSTRELRRTGFGNPFDRSIISISSYSYAAKAQNNLRSVQWDLVIMDEAHKLRNAYRESNKVGQALKWALEGRRKLLLTATPLQNTLTELYGLSTLLDGDYFGDLPTFRARYINNGGDMPALRKRLSEFCWRTLRRDVLAYIKYTNRIPVTEEFYSTDREHNLYQAVSAYLKDTDTYAFPANVRPMLTQLIRKVLASSTSALIGTLEGILRHLRELQNPAPTPEEDFINTLFGNDEDMLDEQLEDAEDAEEDANESDDTTIAEVPLDSEKLQREINLVEDFIRQAKAIGMETKNNRLLTALTEGWSRLREIGAEEKAVIFTESCRSMKALRAFLENNGYQGQVLCFSGSIGNDPAAVQVYNEYRREHPEERDSRAIVMRHAIIDAFKNKAKILIATEAGAEGINLQFCSMVVNYDLPWNPQRVEQRIGRCHRYGQKHDVIVVNFCNKRNAADVRVYQLLSEKFQLFEGLFGASNDILGVIGDEGRSFEARIHKILQQSRTEEEIQAAFDLLQQELDAEIQQARERIHREVIENLDEDVRARLRIDPATAQDYLNEIEAKFMAVTRHTLQDKARFQDNPRDFELISSPAEGIAVGKYSLNRTELPNGYLPYRPSALLGEWCIETAKGLYTELAEVTFDISNYEGRIAAVEALKGQSGFLRVDKMTAVSLETEDFLLFTGFSDDGKMVAPEDLERLFKLGQSAKSIEPLTDETSSKLNANVALLAKATLQKSMEQNNQHFKERLQQLDRWCEDKVAVAERELELVRDAIRTARHEQDVAASLEEQEIIQQRINELERKRRNARKHIDDVEEETEEKRREMLDDIRKRMVHSVTNETLFTIRWSVV